jgi:hypothetical protein
MSESGHFRKSKCPTARSASLIGGSGSSTFRLSIAAVLVSLTGSRFSSESAPGPFQYGIRGRGGAIFTAALPLDERQVQADLRTHLIHRPARDIIPPLGGALAARLHASPGPYWMKRGKDNLLLEVAPHRPAPPCSVARLKDSIASPMLRNLSSRPKSGSKRLRASVAGRSTPLAI